MQRAFSKKPKQLKKQLPKLLDIDDEIECSFDEFSNCKLNTVKQSTQKCYGNGKRKTSHYKESFALPDIPIYTSSPIVEINRDQLNKRNGRNRKKVQSAATSLDVDLVINPCDLSVLNDLKLINQPWLVDYPEVITPYWDIESLLLLPLNYCNDIRKKVEPDSIFENETQSRNTEYFYDHVIISNKSREPLGNNRESFNSNESPVSISKKKRKRTLTRSRRTPNQTISPHRLLRSHVATAANIYNNKNNLHKFNSTNNEKPPHFHELSITKEFNHNSTQISNKVQDETNCITNRLEGEIKQELVDDYDDTIKTEADTDNFTTSNDINSGELTNYIKTENADLEYSVGNLVWARSSKYPFWPAVICHDPVSNDFFIEKPNNNSNNNKHTKTLLYYHVRFFGDNGKRLWIYKRNLMLYCNKNDLEMIALRLKSENRSHNLLKPYIISGSSAVQRKWRQAIDEIESMKFQSFDTIHKFLFDSWINYRTAITKIRSTKRKNGEENDEVKPKKRKLQIDLKPTTNMDVPAKDDKLLLTNDVDVVVKKEEEVTAVDDQPNNNHAEENGSTKSESPPPMIINQYSFEAQLELHRKNYLFSGFRGVKVCDYCLKRGDLFKCKGKCCLYFHLECAEKTREKQCEMIINSGKGSNSNNNNNSRKKKRKQVKLEQQGLKNVDTQEKQLESIKEMSIIELIDYKMKEIMDKVSNRSYYSSGDALTDCEDDDLNAEEVETEKAKEQKKKDVNSIELNAIQHVTADSEFLQGNSKNYSLASSPTAQSSPSPPPLIEADNLKCIYCRNDKQPPCFSCGQEIAKDGTSIRQKCSLYRCGKSYHFSCLKNQWYQTQWAIGGNGTKRINNNNNNNNSGAVPVEGQSKKWKDRIKEEDAFTCPSHKCLTCFSEQDNQNGRLPGEKLARCLLCPTAFHATTFCIPAGTEILGATQIICPRHRSKPIEPINAIWCFICSKGGNLVCCETCPTSIHPECQPNLNLTADDKYICEDCEFGRFPLYDEIVWVKMGRYKWWPALILFPNEIPVKIRSIKHQRGDFAVRFFGTNNHYWVNKGRAFAYQEDDQDSHSTKDISRNKSRINKLFGKAIEDAAVAYKFKKEFKLRKVAEGLTSLKPPPYVKINRIKPVGNVRKCIEMNLSNAIACDCDPSEAYPCGPDSNCINRLLLTECDSDICPAGDRCKNQSFQLREYPPMVPYKTANRGWGLKCLAPIEKGQFIIEYVGELIDSEEYQRRIRKMHDQKNENYYFMTMDADRMIDAGPKGNISRFMNHSCNPNCETQKWTVRGDTRVGLFSKFYIEAGSELTFNYNLELIGQEKKQCYCGAVNCSGFIGAKPPSQNVVETTIGSVINPCAITSLSSSSSLSKNRRSNNKNHQMKRKKLLDISTPLMDIPPCFLCGGENSILTCTNKLCNKSYHLNCLNMIDMPNDAGKFVCPRHNCNVCSNRTMRFCINCTNSFCPMHSNENIFYSQHNKGFICHLHIDDLNNGESSPREEPAQHVNHKSKSKIICTDEAIKRAVILKYFKLRTSINNFSMEEQEIIRQIWREQNQKKHEKRKSMEMPKLGNAERKSRERIYNRTDQIDVVESSPSNNKHKNISNIPSSFKLLPSDNLKSHKSDKNVFIKIRLNKKRTKRQQKKRPKKKKNDNNNMKDK